MKLRFKPSFAFTLLELMVCIGIVATMLTLAVLNFNKVRGKSGAQGLMMVVTDELRRTRQDAIAHRRPTAFCLRTGSTNHTQGFYNLEGEYLPIVTRSNKFSQEFGTACIFTGTWAGPSFTAPGAGQYPGSKWKNFGADEWLTKPSTSVANDDACIIFLPDGSVRTSKDSSHDPLPFFDGNFHLVVASGVQEAGSLQKCGECYTISISPLGGVQAQGGLLKDNSDIVIPGSMECPTCPAPRAIESMASGGDIIITPTPNLGGSLEPKPLVDPPPGIDAFLKVGEFATLKMVCLSTTGEELYAQFKLVTPDTNHTKFPGIFSSPTGTVALTPDPALGAGTPSGQGPYWTTNQGRMNWDPTIDNGNGSHGAWTSTWQYTPPLDAKPGDMFTVQALVQNKSGGSPKTLAIQHVTIEYPGKLLFETDLNHSPDPLAGSAGLRGDVYSMNPGTGDQPKIYKKDAVYPTATLDGSRIVWVSTTGAQHMFMGFREDPTLVQDLNTGAIAPALNPTGNWLAYIDPSTHQTLVMQAMPKGGGNVPVDVDPGTTEPISENVGSKANPADYTILTGTQKLCWNPDGTKLIYQDQNYNMKIATFQSHSATPIVTGRSMLLAASSAGPQGTINWTGPTWTADGYLFIQNQCTGNYGPYLCWATPGWSAPLNGPTLGYHSSLAQEETLPERDPAGGDKILEAVAPQTNFAPLHYRLIAETNTTSTAPPAGQYSYLTNTTMLKNCNCIRPVWTRRP